MKSLGDAAIEAEASAKAARHREWRWCRRPNGFCDKPLWRAVAEQLALPLPHVVAFVNRLEEQANGADPRGYVGEFSAAEFAAALGMSTDDAARIFAALEHQDIRWVQEDHVLSFYQRNPDKEDQSATERKRRSRSFKAALEEIDRQASLGRITAGERRDRQQAVFSLQQQARNGMLAEHELHRKLFDLLYPAPPRPLSTGHGSHAVTERDIVTVTPRADQPTAKQTILTVDNFEDATRGSEEAAAEDGVVGPSGDPQAMAVLWLSSTGLQIVTERMNEPATLASTRIERWLHQRLNGDAVALRGIIEGLRVTDLTVARFLAEVGNGIERARQRPQPELPLKTVLPAKRAGNG